MGRICWDTGSDGPAQYRDQLQPADPLSTPREDISVEDTDGDELLKQLLEAERPNLRASGG